MPTWQETLARDCPREDYERLIQEIEKMTTLKFSIPRDDRPVYRLDMDRDGRRTTIDDLTLRDAIGHARDVAMTMRDGDELVVSDPDGRIHYKETSGSVYFRK
jgi:hypothetical protein